jgi:hypothetical protein
VPFGYSVAKVQIAVPNIGEIQSHLAVSLTKIETDAHGHELGLDCQISKPSDNCRNKIVRRFLEGDQDYLLFIDSDNPPTCNPLEFVDLDLDVLGFPVPIWIGAVLDDGKGKQPWLWNAFEWVEELGLWREWENKDGLQEVDAVGTGCMIIARRVLEAVRPAFIREWDADGVIEKGSDLLFCKRAKEAGFKVWTHFGWPCCHYKTINMLEVYQAMFIRDILHANQPNINTVEYWDKKWKRKKEYRIPPFHNWLAGKLEGKMVMDYGCGRGDLLAHLSANSLGVDFSEEAVRQCRDRGLKATVASWPDPSWGPFDAIVCSQVFEHIEHPHELLTALYELAPTVWVTVLDDCLPPSIEPEHLSVWNEGKLRELPGCGEISSHGLYLVAEYTRPES